MRNRDNEISAAPELERDRLRPITRAALCLLVCGLAVLSLNVSGASASKEVIDYFGTAAGAGELGGEFTTAGGIAVNYTGAGAADPGDVYVADGSGIAGGRIQRFSYNDNDTPSEPYDDSYEFVSAWGVDVVKSGGLGDQGDAEDANFEICTIASQCQSPARVGGNGNGTVAGNGAINAPSDIAIDEDTGYVYVADSTAYIFGNNAKITVYAADGTFLSSFGFDVDASEPGSGYEVCPSTHVCKEGISGSAVGQVLNGSGIAVSAPDGNPDTGTVFLAEPQISRISTFDVDGGNPSFFGSSAELVEYPRRVAIDSRGIVYITGVRGGIDRFDTTGVNGSGVGFLDSIEPSTVSVSEGPGDASGTAPYRVTFRWSLGRTDVSEITASDGALPLTGGAGVSVTTNTQGSASADEIQEVKVAATDGEFRLTFNGESTGASGTANFSAGARTIEVSASTGTFVVGEEISGAGIPADTKIESVAPNSLGISKPVAVTADGVAITADLPSDASAKQVQAALEALNSIPDAPFTSALDLEVDPDLDGPGPDEDSLYFITIEAGKESVLQLGPVNDPGLLVPPAAFDDRHGALVGFPEGVRSLGIDPISDRLFVSSDQTRALDAPENAPPAKQGVYVLGPAGAPPTVSLESVSDVTTSSATVHGKIDPNGGPPVSYLLEYSRDGVNWNQTEKTLVGIQGSEQAITAVLNPLGLGLEPNTLYHVRLVAIKAFTKPVVSSEQTFTTEVDAPQVETTGSPIRTSTTARLEGRVNPRNSATSYRFEYLDDATYQANVEAGAAAFTGAKTTEPSQAGAAGQIRLVSAPVQGLQPGTVYHYRLVAVRGGATVEGAEASLTTRASDASLSHGQVPGPVGSDRGYEQINLDDTGGNPIFQAFGFSEDGNTAAYGISGGTPISDTGTAANVYYAERQPGGWQTRLITPPRAQLTGGIMVVGGMTKDLSTLAVENFEIGSASRGVWTLSPGGTPAKLFQSQAGQTFTLDSSSLSADGSRTVGMISGPGLDPSYPAATPDNLYDLSSGSPKLVSLLPGDHVASCGVDPLPFGFKPRLARWQTDDGRYLFFPSRGNTCSGPRQLYMRDLVAGETHLVAPQALSGPTCEAAFIKTTPGAAFFWSQSRLTSDDTPAVKCIGSADGDVYRYQIDSKALECLTCRTGPDADVFTLETDNGAYERIAVADDGSRIYFTAGPSLLPGAPPDGTYRMRVATGALAYVGQGRVSTNLFAGNALTPDGSVLIFRSDDASLNPVNGLTNGGTEQYYRYDDDDRSLVCLSCPQDGSKPFAGFSGDTTALSAGSSIGSNVAPISDDGTIVAFAAPSSLVNADQNTPKPGPGAAEAATDVYEWRDGRLFLVTDGLTQWPSGSEPRVAGVSPSGADIYFLAAAQYTQDALDGFLRLYDARIGGGFEFPSEARPCPLEVCQGTPKGAPAEQPPSSSTFHGPGNAKSVKKRRCPKGKHRVRRGGRVRCVKKRSGKKRAVTKKSRSDRDRRASR